MMDADVVRHLCLCPVCGKLGDEWVMVRVGPMGCLSHDRCVFEQLGEGILNLPKEEQAKFTLAAVGPDRCGDWSMQLQEITQINKAAANTAPTITAGGAASAR
jgi:hypothetical protein